MQNSKQLYIWTAYPLLLGLLCLGLLTACGTKQPARNFDASPRAKAVLNTAYSQMGKKYRLGGASPSKGFDCSGLIWWVYRKHGISVPRITSDQARAGKPVPKYKAQPGDIVVFRTREGPRGLHTGIYSGNNTFIHSPRKGEKVRMESIETPYWKKKWSSVRRVLP